MEIRKLNSLRALAAVIVMLTHFSDDTGWLVDTLGGRAGQYGVMLFFLLSGFLMSHLYLSRSCTTQNLVRYFRARMARVAPLYLLVVLGSYVACQLGLVGLYDIASAEKLFSHLLFIYGESVLWSIAPEMQFYLLFMLFWLIAGRYPAYIYVLSIAIVIVLFLSNYPRPHGEISGLPYDLHLFRSLPYFLTGMVMGMLYGKLVIPCYLKQHFFILSLLPIPLLYPAFSPVTSDAKMRMWLNLEVLLVMASVFFAIVFLVPDSNRLLANRVGDFLGKISYSLYLLHMPVIIWLDQFTIATGIKLIAFFSLSILLAWLSFAIIEKPCSRLIRHSAR